MKQVLYIFISLLIITSCSKKKYATFCPGEKHIALKHKTVSDKKLVKIQKQIEAAEEQKDEYNETVFEASLKNIPQVKENPIAERLKKHKKFDQEEEEEFKELPINHDASIYAFATYFGGPILGGLIVSLGSFFIPLFILGALIYILSPIVGLVGLIWAIRNTIFLADKKDKFYQKGFSLAVIISTIIGLIFLSLLILLIQMVYGIGPEILILIGILGFIALLLTIPLVYYFTKK